MRNQPPLAPPVLSGFFWSRVIAFGLRVTLLATLSLIMAACLRASANTYVPIASFTALMLLCAKPAIDRIAATRGVARAPVVSALSMLLIAPLLSLGALLVIDDPILFSHWRCEAGEGALDTVMAFFFVLACLGGSFAAATVAHERARVDTLIRVVRGGALGLAAILLACALGRAARKPDPAHYVASLPEVGVIPRISGDPIALLPAMGNSLLPAEPQIHEDRLRDIVVRRACTALSCQVSVRSAHPVEPPETPPAELMGYRNIRMSGSSPLSVRRDEKHDIWVLGDRLAFRGPDFQLIDIHVSTVADGLSAPPGWIVGAGLGLLIAGGSTVQRRRVARRAIAVAGAALGAHDENGWITMEDGGQGFRAAPDLALPVGPVLVFRGGKGTRWEGGPYRGDGVLHDSKIVAGTREAHLAPLRTKMAELDAFALSAQLLTAAPLVAALLRGLVF